jgi:hypothetical protein
MNASASLVRENSNKDKNDSSFYVYLGRGYGNGIAQSPGNRIYRQVIRNNKNKYQIARGNKAKERVATDLVDNIQSMGGTFLSKPNRESAWEIAPPAGVLKRVKQALRERKRY